ncbi:MAG TPA: hypothetical protein VFO93_19085 [Hymenobacter sp.]|uniref:hypothetical protein n=1 Tax=Hymenobacter sp. TaxID=1898978 RepID=UPI002D7FC68B|nr:hypothetical protein [Hymenobacter sp.]HET9505657.1 hypothetical protein [Hymenobacter sp.]
MENPHFQCPTQQPVLKAYAAGELEFERMVYQLIQDALKRAPVVLARLADEAEERATLAREEAEMAANEEADGPTFVDYTKDGR